MGTGRIITVRSRSDASCRTCLPGAHGREGGIANLSHHDAPAMGRMACAGFSYGGRHHYSLPYHCQRAETPRSADKARPAGYPPRGSTLTQEYEKLARDTGGTPAVAPVAVA